MLFVVGGVAVVSVNLCRPICMRDVARRGERERRTGAPTKTDRKQMEWKEKQDPWQGERGTN